jgi:hypothetical protein
MSLTYPNALDAADCAGAFQWDLRINTISRRHFGYRRQFFSTDEIVTHGSNTSTEIAAIP